MKVVHFAIMSPEGTSIKSGMTESTFDQIKYERREGLESDFIDAVRPDSTGLKNGWLEAVDYHQALLADIWVIHSNLPSNLFEYIQKPENRKKHKIVSIMHGPVENMVLKEWSFLMKQIDEPSFTDTHINAIWQWDACVVLNQHEYDISILYDENDKLIYIPNSVDIERYTTDAPKWPYTSHPAIISCDVPRPEKLPVHILWAMPKVVERVPTARLNFFGIPLENVEFFKHLITRAKKRNLDLDCMESFQLKTPTLLPYMNGADIGFNSNFSGICSRVHMEMMLQGVPIVSYNGDYTDYHAKIFDLNSIAEQIERCWKDLNDPKKKLREKTIAYAKKNFSREIEVKKYVKLYEKLKEEQNG